MSMNVSTGYPAISPVRSGDRGSLDSHAHRVQFYDDDAFLLDELSRSIGSALGAGDSAIVIATKEHREGLAQRLEARGLDITRAAGEGRYVSLDAAETLSKFMVEGWPDAVRFTDLIGGVVARATAAAGSEHSRVAAFGEMVALLWAEGKTDAALRLEHLWNDLAQVHSFDLSCGYPIRFFDQASDGAPIESIFAAHSHVIPAESYTSLITEEERFRAIILLQQKAQALETEIQERAKAQEALRQMNEELREAVATRDEFMSVAAHELKTPITSLWGFAQLLLRDLRRKREIPQERLEFALGAIESQTGKLSQLVARLLDSAQIEAGKLRLERVETDLSALVRSALAQQNGDTDHTFALEAPDHLEAVVDPVRFEQVINNLLDNAVKFSPQGGVITVELGQDDEGGIRLSVTDQGIGIPPGEYESVFDRFHQAHSDHHLSGMGLGLYITREIVELHGGSIRIEQPGQRGSRFVVSLPPSARLHTAPTI
ncbi:MAG TPA: ATP-binding protein [Chloroflexia bacterium]|jgi:signal transduction histidine kinase